VASPNTLTEGVTKVPKGCFQDFCHFWHLLTLGIWKNTPKAYSGPALQSRGFRPLSLSYVGGRLLINLCRSVSP
jgi:hypothetical protein